MAGQGSLSTINHCRKNKDILNERCKDYYERNKDRRRDAKNYRDRERYSKMKKAILGCKNMGDLVGESEDLSSKKSKIFLPRDIKECPFLADTSVICICFDNNYFDNKYICYPTEYCIGKYGSDCNQCKRKCKVTVNK